MFLSQLAAISVGQATYYEPDLISEMWQKDIVPRSCSEDNNTLIGEIFRNLIKFTYSGE